MRYLTLFVAITALNWTNSASAHPVTYVGGFVWDAMVRPLHSVLESNYTFARGVAFGIAYRRYELQDRELQYVAPQLNFLLKRWNFSDAQANVYLSTSIGYQEDSLERNGLGSTGVLVMDYETRRFYTAFKSLVTHTANVTPYWLQYRIGFAPYEGKFDELQTWAIAQLDWIPGVVSHLQFTPTLRFFYQNVLWELGSTLDGNTRLQLMVHF